MLYHMNTNLSISFLSAMFTFWLRSSNEPPSEALKTNNFASVALMLVSPLWKSSHQLSPQIGNKVGMYAIGHRWLKIAAAYFVEQRLTKLKENGIYYDQRPVHRGQHKLATFGSVNCSSSATESEMITIPTYLISSAAKMCEISSANFE